VRNGADRAHGRANCGHGCKGCECAGGERTNRSYIKRDSCCDCYDWHGFSLWSFRRSIRK
jgi:hypothetical protein